MQNRMLYILLALVAVILIVRASVFTVDEGQLAIKSIGGEIVDSNYQPGLHLQDSPGERSAALRSPNPDADVSVRALSDA